MPLRLHTSLILGLMLLFAAAAYGLKPHTNLADLRPVVEFQSAIPERFGTWQVLPNVGTQIIDPELEQSMRILYSQTVIRTYANAQGYRVMLSMAYGKTQRADLQLHHPELCYPAQGFEIRSNQVGSLATAFGVLPVRRLETQLGSTRVEPVTYWAMVGDTVVLDSLKRKWVELGYGLHGQIADGLLFRVSSIDRDAPAAFAQQAQFVDDLLAALPPAQRLRVAGI